MNWNWPVFFAAAAPGLILAVVIVVSGHFYIWQDKRRTRRYWGR